MGRAAGGRAGRQAHPVLELPRRPVAPALAHDHRRRRAAAANLRRIRPPQRPLVARRQAHCVHQQRERQYLALGAADLSAAARQESCRRRSAPARIRPRPDQTAGRVRQAHLRARFGPRQRRALARAYRRLDARRRALRPRAVPERSALLPLPGGNSCLQRRAAGRQGPDPRAERLPQQARDLRARVPGRRSHGAAGAPRG